jgi:hypothetical protein
MGLLGHAEKTLMMEVAHSSKTFDIYIHSYLCRGADKYLAFPIFLFGAQPKESFLDGLK